MNVVIFIIKLIFAIVLGILLANRLMYLEGSVTNYKKTKNKSIVYAKTIWKVNIKFIRGIGILLILLVVSIYGVIKLRYIFFFFLAILLFSQGIGDLMLGLVREKITEEGIFTQEGFKEFYWIDDFSWHENKNITSNALTLCINMGTNEKKLEFVILKDKKAEIDEFLQQNTKHDMKKGLK